MVLTQKIIEAGFKLLDESNLAKKPAMQVKRDIDTAKELVVTKLKELATPVESKDDIFNIAFTSLEDEKLAHTLTTLVSAIGLDGLVTVEDGEFYETESRIEKGIELTDGLVSPYLGDNDGKAEAEHVSVMVTNFSISSLSQISQFASPLASEGKLDLVVFAPDFTGDVVSDLVMNKLDNNFRVIAVKCDNDENLRDVALLTGTTVFDKNTQKPLTDYKHTELGAAEKVTSEKDKTIIIATGADASARIAELRTKLDSAREAEKADIRKRIAGFDKGVGIIKVGAASEEEREYIRLKLEDGINAVKSAMELGKVPGGGMAYAMIAEQMKDSILYSALTAPFTQIEENAGGTITISPTIVDPVKTLIKALENACSAAGVLLTAGIAIANKNEDRRTLEK
jgi:chaperonin GroEL